jgi:hypothetical protein
MQSVGALANSVLRRMTPGLLQLPYRLLIRRMRTEGRSIPLRPALSMHTARRREKINRACLAYHSWTRTLMVRSPCNFGTLTIKNGAMSLTAACSTGVMLSRYSRPRYLPKRRDQASLGVASDGSARKNSQCGYRRPWRSRCRVI